MWVGANMRKKREMLRSWIGRERASWEKSDKTEEDAPIADRRQRSELGQK